MLQTLLLDKLRSMSNAQMGNARDPLSKPWMLNPKWRTGKMNGAQASAAIIAVVMAVVWNGTVIFSLWVLTKPGTQSYGNMSSSMALWMVGLFGVIGVIIAVSAVVQVLRWKRFGKTELILTTLPGEIGGMFQATLHLPEHDHPQNGYQVKLSCTNRTVHGHGKHRRISVRRLWEDSRVVARGQHVHSSHGKLIKVPIEFAVPGHVEETDNRNSRDQIIWKLVVKADIPGVDVNAEFDVPIFRLNALQPAGATSMPSDPMALPPIAG